MSTEAMILVAGEGSRLRPLTLDRPKPMLPVAGKPVLEYIIRWLGYYEIRRIAINLHYLPHVVMEHFGSGTQWGVELKYSIEEEVILGTAGGVKRVEDYLGSPVIVVYGDVLTDFDLRALLDFHKSRTVKPHLSMCLYAVENPWECGIVGVDQQGEIVRFVEKPVRQDVFSNLANAGILIVDHEILEFIPENSFYDFGHDLIPRLLQSEVPVYGWQLPNDSYLVDIGTPSNYGRAQMEWPTKRARQFLEQQTP